MDITTHTYGLKEVRLELSEKEIEQAVLDYARELRPDYFEGKDAKVVVSIFEYPIKEDPDNTETIAEINISYKRVTGNMGEKA